MLGQELDVESVWVLIKQRPCSVVYSSDLSSRLLLFSFFGYDIGYDIGFDVIV